MKKIVILVTALVLASCGNNAGTKQPSEKPMKTYYPPAVTRSAS